MYSYITIFNEQVPTYMICALAGIFISILTVQKLLLERLLLKKYIRILLISSMGLFLVARLFGILSKYLGELYCNGSADLLECVEHSGIVFLGGVIGYLISFILICKIKKYDVKEIANIIAIIIPLFHIFGRIGCYFAGCCYGAESTGFLSLPYRLSIESEFVNRIPVQLIEAFMELLLFIFIFVRYKRKLKLGKADDGKLLYFYLYAYCVFRFVIEFWRGDEVRGVYGAFSFSQIISGLIILVITGLCFYGKERKDG